MGGFGKIDVAGMYLKLDDQNYIIFNYYSGTEYRRVSYRAVIYHTEGYLRYYNEQYCCSGFRRRGSTCERELIVKSLIYLFLIVAWNYSGMLCVGDI